MAENGKKGFLFLVPLIVIVVLVYNLLAFAGPSFIDQEGEGFRAYVASVDGETAAEVSDKALQVGYLLDKHVSFTMMSGDIWRFSLGTGILVLALLFLFWEITRATDTGSSSVINNAVSMIVFIVCLVEFLLLPGFATSVFFLITVMSLFDVVGGFIITAISARRDFGGGGIPLAGA